MRKHNLLLSMLALLFAVFMTACDNGSANNAKAPVDPGNGDAGVIVKPSLTIEYNVLDAFNVVELKGIVTNADPDNYTYMWDYDDGNTGDDGLVSKHTYTEADNVYEVRLIPTPISADVPALPEATAYVTISKTGIVVQAFRYSALSGMEYEFQALATTTDNSQLLYTWKINDEVYMEDTEQNAITYRFTKFNTEYKVSVSVRKAGDNTVSLNFPNTATIRTPGLTAQMTVENDPSIATLKRMSVNFYDSTGALVHGYSDATGEVNGLDNVTYKWDFDNDGTVDETTNVRYVEHNYNGGSGTYDIKMTATSDTYEGTVEATGTADVTLTYALTGLNARFTDAYGLELQVDISGNGGETFKDRTVYYEVTLPDNSNKGVDVAHNGSAAVSKSVTHTLSKYYPNYNITVTAKESANGKVLAQRTTTLEKPSFRYVLNGPDNGDSYFNKTFTVTPAEGSLTLKNARFTWNFGEGAAGGTSTTVGNASYTYSGPGNKTVTVGITSDLLRDSGISISQLVKTFTINADVTINSFSCFNTKNLTSNLLEYRCEVKAAAASGLTLTYKWYQDGEHMPKPSGPSYIPTFDAYNKNYTIKVEVGVEESSDIAAKTKEYVVTTPNINVVLDGPTSTIHGQTNRYVATTKVVVDSTEKTVTLTNPTYAFRLVENSNGQSDSSNVWSVAFSPDPKEYNSNNTVTRTAYVDVTAGNLTGKRTSNSVTTSVRKEEASLASFNQPVITCTPASSVNQIRQNCVMRLTAKTGIDVTGRFEDYTAKFYFNNTSYTAKFPAGDITSGAYKEVTKQIDFEWPSYGEYTTGSTPTQTYKVTGEVYKTDTPAKKSPAREASINVTLNADYTLFPLVDSMWYRTSGGSGYKFGTWSCGHNETTSSQVSNPKCGSGNSVSGQALKLGNFVDGSGKLKETLKFKWHIRIRSANGNNLADTVIKEFTVNKGQFPSDEQLSFNIAKILNDKGVRYVGSAYGPNNVFYLEITSDNKNTLAKPVKIWYNGASKGDKGNRLRKITPMIENAGYNTCTVSYLQSGDEYTGRSVTFYLTEAKVNFDRADKNNGIYDLIPNSGNYRPFFRFTSSAKDKFNWAENVVNNIQDIRIERNSSYVSGWLVRDNTWSSSSRTAFPNTVNIGSNGLHDGWSEMKLIFKDMLEGAGGAEISYYPTLTCNKSVGSIK